MLSRRSFLGTAAGFAFAPSALPADPPRKKLAVVTTIWTYRSHAWHMAERFLAGYSVRPAGFVSGLSPGRRFSP